MASSAGDFASAWPHRYLRWTLALQSMVTCLGPFRGTFSVQGIVEAASLLCFPNFTDMPLLILTQNHWGEEAMQCTICPTCRGANHLKGLFLETWPSHCLAWMCMFSSWCLDKRKAKNSSHPFLQFGAGNFMHDPDFMKVFYRVRILALSMVSRHQFFHFLSILGS